MGSALAVLFGAPFGALVAFVIVLTSLPPSVASLEADAEALVLPGSDLVNLGSNTGATMIVGWERWSTAQYEDHRNRQVVHDLLVERASELGWSVDRESASAFGSSIEASKPLSAARITVGSQVEQGERIEATQGYITVSRNEERRTVLFWSGVGLGALAGGWVGQRLYEFARERPAPTAD